MSAAEYYDDEAKPLRCDCDPPREPIIRRGEEAMRAYLGAGLPLPAERARLQYLATCPDFPNGCEWIEGTWETLT